MSAAPEESPRAAPPSRPAKSSAAFRTISEVAEELDLPQHVLRFWETRFSQIKPLKRAGGRRLYRPDHVALLRGIKALLYDDGMTIKGVQKMLREKGVKTVIARGEATAALTLAEAEPPLDAASRLASLRERLGAVAEPRPSAGEPAPAAAPGAGAGKDAEAGQGAEAGREAEAAPPAGVDLERIRASIARLESLLARLEGR